MEGFFILLSILAIGCVLSGPVALIISIIALNRSKTMYPAPRQEDILRGPTEPEGTQQPQEEPKQPPQTLPDLPEKPVEPVKEEPQIQRMQATEEGQRPVKEIAAAGINIVRKPGMLEQRIGTQWVLIAGVITVIMGVGFFLKYAYDNDLIGPLGRVVIAAVAGFAALAVGEITRRRGYGIVAKGVTALGFAILYAAVFSAYRFYELISTTPAFALAILVTVAAMLYAVSLNEIVMALLSLLGGFLTPLIVSTGENLPVPLFIYVLILGVGAMLCAYYRKWPAVNLVAFVGTYALYASWFEKFFRPALTVAEGPPEQIAIAMGWLGVFFAVYLVLPILNGLIKRTKAQQPDVLLVLTNAAVTFFYFWTILFAEYRTELAFCALGLCAAHLLLMSIAIRRCANDLNLRLALLAIGLFFLTIAIPLYLKMYAVAMAWAAEGVVLVIIGLRYRSAWTQVGAAAALVLSLAKLLHQLPIHTGAFTLVLNPAFGTWCFVSAAMLLCHIIYRKNSTLPQELRQSITEILYALTALLLMAAVTMEWYWHCDYNITEKAVGDSSFIQGMMLIFTVFMLLFVTRPICPKGMLCKLLTACLAALGSVNAMAFFTEIYTDSFPIFLNLPFAIALIFVAGLFLTAWLFSSQKQKDEYSTEFATAFVLAAIAVLLVLLTEQVYFYWYCRNRFVEKIANWRFLAHMYISVMWAMYGAALIVVGFWRKIGLLRYIAIGLFGLLLAKVFILDTATVKSVYRIAAFLATGVTLLAVSYLYQFLRKQGFFEAILAKKDMDK
ncbi:MAG: DUF2339 domain-containing protein [Planctomycetota bacterium]|jgi:uncharacterized membrane protein